MEASSQQRDRRVEQQIRAWRDELINLTRRNGLLFYRPTRASTLEISAPSATAIVDHLYGSKEGWSFYEPPPPPDDEEDIRGALERKPLQPRELLTQKDDAAGLRSTLAGLDRKSTQEFLDKGLWVLYLGVGMLNWVDPDTSDSLRSPLALFPVALSRENPRMPFSLVLGEDDPVANPALVVKFESDFNMALPTWEDPEDVAGYLSAIDAAIKAHPNAGVRSWRVSSDAVVRTFSFHKEVMYRDLLGNSGAVSAHPVVRSLALGVDADHDLSFDLPVEARLDEESPPETTITILDADATQRRCIAAANAKHSFVMDGPPGTGKSQTIANIIAALIHDGQSVLFVSEKAAALEVVASRLKDVGLGQYLLELHSHKATRKEFAHSLIDALTHQTHPLPEMPTYRLSEVAYRRRSLSAYAAAQNEVRQPLDRSLHDVLGRLSHLSEHPLAPVPATVDASLAATEHGDILGAAEGLGRAWGPVSRSASFFWSGCRFEGGDAGALEQVKRDIASALQRVDTLYRAADSVAARLAVKSPLDESDLDRLVELLRVLEARPPSLPESWLTSPSIDYLGALLNTRRERSDAYHAQVTSLEAVAGSDWTRFDADLLGKLAQGVEDLREVELGPVDAADLRSVDIDPVLARVVHVMTTAIQLAEGCSVLGRQFERPNNKWTLSEVSQFSSIASMIGAGVDPDPLWLDPIRLDKAREAANLLRSAAVEYEDARNGLRDVFTEAVLDLDLAQLKARFAEVHTGIRKLGSAYRADKRAVGEATLSGKVTKTTLARLDDALEWQELRSELRRIEQARAADLGTWYYDGIDTDWVAVDAALDKCSRVIELAEDLVQRKVLQHMFGAGSTPPSDVRRQGAKVESIWSSLSTGLGQIGIMVEPTTDLQDLLSRLHAVHTAIVTVADVLHHADEVARLPLSNAQVQTCKILLDHIHGLEREAESTAEGDRAAFADLYLGHATDFDALNRQFDWANSLRERIGSCDHATAAALLHTELTSSDLEPLVNAWRKSREQLTSWFESPYDAEIDAQLGGEESVATRCLNNLLGSVDDIEEWVAFDAARSQLEDHGLREVVEFCVEQEIPAPDVAHVVERAVLTRWTDLLLKSDRRLSPQRRSDRDALVSKYREIDSELSSHSVAQVIKSCNGRRPQATNMGAAAIIMREGQKKTRHLPVRMLMAQARDVIQSLKPCFMMSPLSVSQYLDADTRFDVVIFDEASQVLPADAINCIYRGHRVIIAGDQKQLPPTSFFQRMDAVDESAEFDEEELDTFESILDIAKGSGLASLPLQWHYRSQHESLIAFSNYSFYNGELVTYPGATDAGSDVGVHLIKVDGTYRRGTTRDNPVEAEKVAERVLFHARANPDLTLGVVAFSEAQASLIEAVVDSARLDHPELDEYFTDDRLDGFFVKNLESVQGDERDIVIFSVGYGPDQFGAPVTGNFGPLTRQGGERRLNVAITRARQRVEVISSISSSDFRPTWRSAGVRQLGRYLDFAQRGLPALALEEADPDAYPESPFEESVLTKIRSWGYDAVPQVGTAGYRIDIGIRHPTNHGSFALGVECDGAMYHSSRVARDRDRLRQQVLERLGWKIYRIWGTSWYRTRDREEDLLRDAIEDAISGSDVETRSAPAPKILVEVRPVEFDDIPSWVRPYRAAILSPPSNLKMLDASTQGVLRDAIFTVVQAESPVHESIALRRVREAWGVRRAGSQIQAAFDTQVKVLIQRTLTKRDSRGFLWRPNGLDSLAARSVVRNDPSTKRKVEHVAGEELRFAMLRLLEDAKSAEHDELTAVTARLFGWERRGPDIAEALDKAVASLIRAGKVEKADGVLRPTGGSG